MTHSVTLHQLARHLGRPAHGVALEPAGGEPPLWLCTACVEEGWTLWRTDEGNLRATSRGATLDGDSGRSVVGTRPEPGEECSSCAISGVGVWAGHQWLRLRDGRLVTGELSGEPGTDVSDVTVDEELVRRAAIAPGGIVAVDGDGRVIKNWLPGYRGVDGAPRFVSVR